MCAALGSSILARMACGVHAKPADTSEMVDEGMQFKEGHVVPMRDYSLPRNQWPMAI